MTTSAQYERGGLSQFPRNINIVPVCCDLLNGPRLKLLRRQLKTETPNSIFFSISRFAMCGGSDNNSRSCGLQYLTRVLNRVRQGDLHQDNGHAACGPNLSQRASMLHPQTFSFCVTRQLSNSLTRSFYAFNLQSIHHTIPNHHLTSPSC